jgi:hypothetical protein
MLSRGQVVSRDQATYHGLKKPREASHDADLYRLYNKVSDEIESRGARVLRVRLDYEIKDELYSRIARTAKEKGRKPEAVRAEVAERYHLKVVSGKIPIPDLRIEYVNENDNQIQYRDLELATDHYRPRGLSEKARAGFQIYARREETSRLRLHRSGGPFPLPCGNAFGLFHSAAVPRICESQERETQRPPRRKTLRFGSCQRPEIPA